MAIVSMDKISVVALESQKRQILKYLMNQEIVQIDDSSVLTEDEEIGSFLEKDGDEGRTSFYEHKMTAVSQAIATLNLVANKKKPLFAKKRQAEKMKSSQVEGLYSFAVEVNTLSKRIVELKANENILKNRIEAMTPWAALKVPLETTGTRFTKLLLGILPSNTDMEAVDVKLAQEAPESTIGIINSDQSNNYMYLIAHKTVFDKALETVKNFGFSAVNFSDLTGTPSEVISQCENLIQKSENERNDINAELLKKSENLSDLETLYDYFGMEKDQADVRNKFVKTSTTFCFNGWLPRENSEEIKKYLTENFDCCVYITQGDKKEGTPILLKNNTLVEPFESIVSMYSLPHSSNVDPSALVAFFYWFFFGMMLSDAGYGIIMTLVCGFVYFKFKPDGGMGKLIKMFMLCGISTTIWGLIFGSIFGGLIPFPGLLDPLIDVMPIMGLALVFGIIHLYIGLGVQGYMAIRDGHALDAIWDVLSWYLFVTGLVILIVPTVAGEIPEAVTSAGKVMAIVGMVLLICTQGRTAPTLFGKAFGGVKSLYGITSYFGDILSYLRLMALCLSTGVIAQVLNMLAAMAGIIPAILIGVIGHTINLLINALGAYVHTSRLQYVEFFGKFYEGGGKAFEPFKLKSKYVTFKEEK